MAYGLDELQHALAERYEVLRELGAGGMAVVYLARDLRHDRQVAVKVLRPDLAIALGPGRFLREIEIAAKLQHPNVLGLLDSGQADGVPYYVMPYIAGESLRGRLERETQLPVEDALRIAAEVADALAYANRLGIVHRDIKPENILLSDGHAVVADFGIAAALSAAGGEKLTQTGVAIGTPQYMSPEQSAGAGKLDGRSDQYALACVLYEMLAGGPPFSGPSAQAIMARHSVDPVPSLRSVRGTVHPGIEWAITKAMAKVPADRYATADEFKDALAHPERTRAPKVRRRRLATAFAATLAGVLLLAATNVGGVRSRLLGRPAAGTVQSLAVLPIQNLTGDTTMVFMVDGMTDQFFTDLAQIEALRVIGRTSVTRARQSATGAQQIATTLHVDAVLAGSLRRAGDSLTFSIQLISAATGEAIFANSYVGVMADILSLQNSVARDVAGQIKVALRPAEIARLTSSRHPVDPAAYALYVRGQFFWNQGEPGDHQRALGFFNQALRADPTYAAAYAGVARAYNALGYGNDLAPSDAFPRAKAAAARALELDSSSAEAHTELAYATMYYDWDWAGAEREFRTALTLKPNDAGAHSKYSLFLLMAGRFDEAESQSLRAMQLDPLALSFVAENAWVAHYSGRQDSAVARGLRAKAMDSLAAIPHLYLGRAYQAQGRYADAMREYEATGRLRGWSVTIASAGYVAAVSGDRPMALRALATLDSLSRAGPDYVAPLVRALVYTALGDRDRAFALLNQSVDERVHWLVWLNRDPRWIPLRSDPRFAALVRRVGLPS